jgi:proline iminopeptidase
MFVAINGVRLFFDVLNPKLEIVGDTLREKPVLVCLHGGPATISRCGPSSTVSRRWRRWSISISAGEGAARGGDPAGWTLDQWGDDVAAFCDALGIVRPIVLGVSGGAIVA